MSAELVIMAAGMGSRFGGLKQAAPMGPNGEIIIDFSVYDAKRAGFEKAVIIIRHDFEKEFRDVCGRRIEKMIDVEYAFQEKEDLPTGFTLPDGREKPWGTGHAILCAKNAIKNPFLVINADDYYGTTVYDDMYKFLSTEDGMCLAGYKLGNTLSENGSVTRGVCTVENGILTSIEECKDIPFDTTLPHDTIVSMNMWGLDPGVLEFLDEEFVKFLKDKFNEPKTEYLLPEIIDKRIKTKNTPVKVIETNVRWLGVTYPEDAPYVRSEIKKLVEAGLYSNI